MNHTLSPFRTAMALASLALLTSLQACVGIPTPDNAAPYNRALNHKTKPDKQLSCIDIPAHNVCVRPGMKLVFLEMDAGRISDSLHTIVESRSEWIVPKWEDFHQEDMFHLSHLIAESHKIDYGDSAPFDPADCYASWARKGLSTGASSLAFQTQFLKLVLEHILVNYAPISTPGNVKADSAAAVQSWMRNLGELGGARQRLKLRMPIKAADGSPVCLNAGDNTEVEVDEIMMSGSMYQVPQEAVDFPANAQSVWYEQPKNAPPAEDQQPHVVDQAKNRPSKICEQVKQCLPPPPKAVQEEITISPSRAFINVEVQVIDGRTGASVFVPVDDSIADVAIALGTTPTHVTGLRRASGLMPPHQEGAGPMGATEVRFVETTLFYGTPAYVPMARSAMFDMLVAPGDVILVD